MTLADDVMNLGAPVAERRRMRRDLLALALLVLGVMLVIAAAFMVDPRLGVAASGAALIFGGIIAGLDT